MTGLFLKVLQTQAQKMHNLNQKGYSKVFTYYTSPSKAGKSLALVSGQPFNPTK